MNGVARLRAEHELIEPILGALEAVAERAEAGEPVPATAIRGAVDFFTTFVDRVHHAKEEEGLSPVLEARGLPEVMGPLETMRREHERGRVLLRGLRRELGTPRGASELAAALRSYVTLLREHFANENTVLFPRAERTMSEEDERRVQAAFDAVEERVGGPPAYAALVEVGRALVAACRVGSKPTAGQRRATVASEVMRPNVPALDPGDSLAQAAQLMGSLRVRELPVVDGGALVGILTVADLEPHRGQFEWTPVRAAMTHRPVTVQAHTPVQSIARLLVERCINSVPVMAGSGLVGMVARSDLLRVLIDALR